MCVCAYLGPRRDTLSREGPSSFFTAGRTALFGGSETERVGEGGSVLDPVPWAVELGKALILYRVRELA